MAEEEFDLFCTQCGQRISKDTVFCPSCGAQVAEQYEGASASKQTPARQADSRMSSRLMAISILLVVSAVAFIAIGIYYMTGVDAMIDALKSDPSWPDLVSQMADLGYTEDQFVDLIKTVLVWIAAGSIICGAAMAVAAVCGFTRKLWVLGFICCIIATVLSSASLLGLIVGIIVTYMYYTTKPCFA